MKAANMIQKYPGCHRAGLYNQDNNSGGRGVGVLLLLLKVTPGLFVNIALIKRIRAHLFFFKKEN
jgi:hypothetical protein